MENSAALSVALVGWTGSSTDRELYQSVGKLLGDWESPGPTYDSDMAELWPHAHTDPINLNQGRDFLKERGGYDVVILCWIFAPKTFSGHEGEYNVSPQHTPEEWRRRLVSTGAKYIFAYGGGSEVGGNFLGAIAGYRMLKTSSNMTVYINWNLYA